MPRVLLPLSLSAKFTLLCHIKVRAVLIIRTVGQKILKGKVLCGNLLSPHTQTFKFIIQNEFDKSLKFHLKAITEH